MVYFLNAQRYLLLVLTTCKRCESVISVEFEPVETPEVITLTTGLAYICSNFYEALLTIFRLLLDIVAQFHNYYCDLRLFLRVQSNITARGLMCVLKTEQGTTQY